MRKRGGLSPVNQNLHATWSCPLPQAVSDQPAALRLRGRVALLSGIDIFAVSIARGYRLGYHHRHC